MRLLALATDAFGGTGGIARFNCDLLAALAGIPRVQRIDVACRHAPRVEFQLPSRVTQHWVPGGRFGFALKALTAGFAGRYDAVFCGHLNLAPAAAAVARLRRVPLWIQLHGIEAWRRPHALRVAAAERADLVTAISRRTRERFLGWADLPPHRVRVLPNTVGGEFSPGPKPPELVERYALAGKKVLLTVSRLEPGDRYKGHERVFLALRSLIARRQDVAYLVVGDGEDRPRLERAAASLGLSAHVKFAGHVADRDRAQVYRLADVFVMPSDGEGFGIVFVEAAATGLPVIGGCRDGSADALADGALGTPVDPHDPAALLGAIEAALANPARPAGRSARFGQGNFRRQVQLFADRLLQ